MSDLTRRDSSRWAVAAVMAFSLAAAVLALPRLTFEPGLRFDQPTPSSFPTPAPLFLIVPSGLSQAFALAQDLERDGWGTWSGLWTYRGPDGEPLWAPGESEEAARERLKQLPGLREVLELPGQGWVLSAPARETWDYEGLEAHLSTTGALLAGKPWYDHHFDKNLRRDFAALLPAAVGLLLVLFALVTRSPWGVAVLGAGALLPASGVIAAYGWLGIPLGYASLLAPILILGLSTVYSLHSYHHAREGGAPETLWAARGKAIVWSGSTAAAGFATLLFSPVTDLKRLGAVILFGIALSFLWNLWLLPRFFRGWIPPHDEAPRPLRPRRRTLPVVALVVALAAAVPGFTFLTTGIHWSAYLPASQPLGAALQEREVLAGDRSPATLVLSWPEEGGWLEPARWEALREAESRWRTGAGVQVVLGPASLVAPDLTLTQESLAEQLELLPRARPEERLIDGQRSSVALRFFWSTKDSTGAEAVLASLETVRQDALIRFPGVQARWSGPLYDDARSLAGFVEGQIYGMSAYFLVVALVAFLRLRRLSMVFWVLLPPVTAGAVLLGFMGWAHWALTPPLALVVSELAGVGTDDALLWALLGPTASLRRALIESTTILVGGLSILLLSSFENIVRIGAGGMAALTISTLVVLWVLPWHKKQP